MRAVRIWDLPTRLFHWLLAASVVGLIATGQVGGNAMVWHFRLGHVVLALLAFRLVWGLVGGRWSRFSSFLYPPRVTLAYLRGDGAVATRPGHSPLGALSVFALLALLTLQVASGLLSDDEIAFAGPLTSLVSGATVSQATRFHKDIGQLVLIALVALHVAAILFYLWRRKDNLVKPMLLGDKPLAQPVPASRDDVLSRLLAVVVFAACSGLAAWVSLLGA